MRYGQIAKVRTWVEQHDKLRTTYGYEILHEDGSVAASGTTVNILVKKTISNLFHFEKLILNGIQNITKLLEQKRKNFLIK